MWPIEWLLMHPNGLIFLNIIGAVFQFLHFVQK